MRKYLTTSPCLLHPEPGLLLRGALHGVAAGDAVVGGGGLLVEPEVEGKSRY